MDECKQFEHEWEQVYYGLKCKACGLFYPDNGNYFAPPESWRDTLYDYFNGEEEIEGEVETVICARCGEEYSAEEKECVSCGLSREGRLHD